MSARMLPAERFWGKIDKNGPVPEHRPELGPCWAWTGHKDDNGYGQFYLCGGFAKAYRFSWELHNGPIPDGLWVLHKCDRPCCCNPAHLFLGTRQDNVDDMVAKGRWRPGTGRPKAGSVRPVKTSKRRTGPRDLQGQTFGRLTVLGPAKVEGPWKCVLYPDRWECACECGEVVVVVAKELFRQDNKATKSCGCLRRDNIARLRFVHGQSHKSREYVSWQHMLRRCDSPSRPGWENYGGRGIKVCERWRQSFVAFLEDMGPKPSPKHSLERIDNDGDYEPGNCRWATRVEQSRNRRSTRFIEYQGETLSLAEWADRLGISHAVLLGRLNKGGWSVERAFTEPVRKRSDEVGVRTDDGPAEEKRSATADARLTQGSWF
jgi:hypothetical protein